MLLKTLYQAHRSLSTHRPRAVLGRENARFRRLRGCRGGLCCLQSLYPVVATLQPGSGALTAP